MARVAGVVPNGRADLFDTLLLTFGGDRQIRSGRSGEAAIGVGGDNGSLAEDEGVLVALDGRIYNAAELGDEADHAALIARLYRRHGFEGALRRLNGDFAVALYDPADGTLLLARDRFGVKPLYYARAPELFAFASQPRGLTGLLGVGAIPDRRFVAVFAASHYRYFDNEPERSPYAGVEQLPAAHMLTYRNGTIATARYWALEDAPELGGSEADIAEQYRDLLADAVAIRLAHTRRPAFTLSGGMDSSSVLASAVRASGTRQEVFSTVYADPTYDEREEIRPMLDATVKEWRPVMIGVPDVFGLVERMVAIHDEPVATATWLSHLVLLEEVAAGGFTDLFGGLGGDELNAGEYEYFFFHFADLRQAGRDDELAREIELWVRHHDHPVFRKSAGLVEEALPRLTDPSRPGVIRPDRARLERYAGLLNAEFFDLGAYEPRMEHPFRSYLKNRAYQDLFYETLPCCLRAQDRHGAALGVESIVPFLDHRLAELLFRVPGSMKIRSGVTKRVLRTAMTGILPEATRTRVKKTGWNAPAHVWFTGAGAEQVRDLVRSQSFRERGIYDIPAVERLIDEHETIVASGEPVENHMMFLWQLVNLELWLRQRSAHGPR